MNDDLITRFRWHAADDPARPAVVEVGRSTTTASYDDLDVAARALAGWLRSQAAVGDRVLLVQPSPIGFAKAFLGCLYAGCVPVPAPLPGLSDHHLALTTGIALDAGPRLVLTDTAHLDLVADWLVQDGLEDLALFATDLVDLSTTEPIDPVSRSSAAALLYTSTPTSLTGHLLTHAELAADIDRLDAAVDFAAHGTVGGWLLTDHGPSLIGLLAGPLSVGASTVLMSPTGFFRQPLRWLQLIDDYDVRLTMAPAFGYDVCVRRIPAADLQAVDLSRLRTALIGPDPVPAATIAAVADRFAPCGLDPRALTPAYGHGVRVITVSPPGDRTAGPLVVAADQKALERNLVQPGADGVPLVGCGPVAGTGLRIVDPVEGLALGDDLVGEIELADGSRTGELGAVHEGQLYPTGRLTDRLVIDRRSLYADEVERAVNALDPRFAGLSGCVFGIDVLQEQVVVLQEVRPGIALSELEALAAVVREGLRDRLRVRVANVVFLRPGQIRRSAERVQRTLMRDLFCSDALGPLLETLGRRTAQTYRIARSAETAGRP
ncbi:AMP-binding protein [Kribbella sp. HUAS MG21]|uniref:AMP-binding protein n=1 Tax=Kribbella sp. HUAS MG21 TaxID=3160966 RepID=A0AAU7TDR6_9ACTN